MITRKAGVSIHNFILCGVTDFGVDANRFPAKSCFRLMVIR